MHFFRYSHWKRINDLSATLLDVKVEEREAAFAKERLSDLKDVKKHVNSDLQKKPLEVIDDFDNKIAIKMGITTAEAKEMIHIFALNGSFPAHGDAEARLLIARAVKSYTRLEVALGNIKQFSESLDHFLNQHAEEETLSNNCFAKICS